VCCGDVGAKSPETRIDPPGSAFRDQAALGPRWPRDGAAISPVTPAKPAAAHTRHVAIYATQVLNWLGAARGRCVGRCNIQGSRNVRVRSTAAILCIPVYPTNRNTTLPIRVVTVPTVARPTRVVDVVSAPSEA